MINTMAGVDHGVRVWTRKCYAIYSSGITTELRTLTIRERKELSSK